MYPIINVHPALATGGKNGGGKNAQEEKEKKNHTQTHQTSQESMSTKRW